MPADDHPVDALQHQFEVEDSSTLPVARALAKLGSALPLPSPLDKVFDWFSDRFASDGQARLKLLVDVLAAEVKKLDDKSRQLFDSEIRINAAKDLLLDAARKAVNTRAMERVKRIGLILAHGITGSEAIDSDEIEEMMRVAMELSDVDVSVLREMWKHDSKGRLGHRIETRGVRGFEMKDWYGIDWHALGFTEHKVESACGKLYSFGLVAPLASSDNRPPGNTFAVPLNAYELLRKGRDFINWTRSGLGGHLKTGHR